jgi:hypothetical protein
MTCSIVMPLRSDSRPWGDGQRRFGFSRSGAGGGHGRFDSLSTGNGETTVDYEPVSQADPDALSLPLLGGPP